MNFSRRKRKESFVAPEGIYHAYFRQALRIRNQPGGPSFIRLVFELDIDDPQTLYLAQKQYVEKLEPGSPLARDLQLWLGTEAAKIWAKVDFGTLKGKDALVDIAHMHTAAEHSPSCFIRSIKPAPEFYHCDF